MSSTRRWVAFCLSQLLFAAPLAYAQTTSPAATGKPADAKPETVVARQGDTVVTLADVDAFAQRMEEQQRPVFFDSPKRLDSLITSLLVQKQLAAEAEKNGLSKEPLVAAQVQLATVETLSKARLKQLQAEVKLPDFDQLAKEEYIGHKEKYATPGKLDVKHVLISIDKHSDQDAKALADQVEDEAKAHPQKFDELIEEYSEDPSKAQNQGLMTDARNKHYVPAFSAAAAALKAPGEISPVIKTKFGYHVLKLITRTSDVPQKFDDVKAQIVSQLRSAYIEKSVGRHTDELRNKPVDANPEVVASLRERYGKAPAAPSDVPSS